MLILTRFRNRNIEKLKYSVARNIIKYVNKFLTTTLKYKYKWERCYNYISEYLKICRNI